MKYAIADTHFWHRNIIKYDNRPFKDVDTMNEAMIQSWNSVVKDGDTVYHLGDFAMVRNLAKIEEVYRRLNGTIVFIRGNHDEHLDKLFPGEVVDVKMVKHGGYRFWLSHYQHAVWPDKHRGAIHLFGHSHGRHELHFQRAIDVCANSISYTPVSFDALITRVLMEETQDAGS